MTYSEENLGRVAQIKFEIANHLTNIAENLQKGELEGEKLSGKLGLEREIQDINLVSQNLRKGVFRIVVLGELKRGKSTLINALLGEKLLPSDVNPSTALLTVLRYGIEKKVTVYFKDNTSPEKLDFDSFKDKYTINPDEGKQLEESNQLAFPNVDYAVVECPLKLLNKGIEIVDTPGLNDTEARDQLSLNYLNNCHAILFVLRASQPITLKERRYLDNYIKGRGFDVFFIINAWDEIKKQVFDPEDSEEIEAAENKLRQVFKANLSPYFLQDSNDIYSERVFEISSLIALRQRLKNPDSLDDNREFQKLIKAIYKLSIQERVITEFRQAKIVAKQGLNRLSETINIRLPLLEKDLNELKEKIRLVTPEFEKLMEIRDNFQAEIQRIGDRQAKATADYWKSYILNLDNSFETDFLRYQPDLAFLEFLRQDKREEFLVAFKKAFEDYLKDKIANWELTAEREISQTFEQLVRSAENYATSYSNVLVSMSDKLLGQEVNPNINREKDTSPSWASWAMGFLSLATANVAGIVLAGAGFDWKNILVNWLGVIGISAFLGIFTGMFFGPIGLAIIGFGVGAFQAEEGRKEFIKAVRKEFVKYLPELANKYWDSIYITVKDCFENYELEVIKRINDDIKSRKGELENLVASQESFQIDKDKESKRLQDLKDNILSEYRQIESAYEGILLTMN